MDDELLRNYGLNKTQIKNIESKYPFCFEWRQRSGDAFQSNEETALMHIYPNIDEFMRMEYNLPLIMNLSWFQVLLKMLPDKRVVFVHEMTHLINTMRGSSLGEFDNNFLGEEYLNSSEEIQATYIEISEQIKKLVEQNDEEITYLLSLDDSKHFINYIMYRFSQFIGIGTISKEVENKYRVRFYQLFMKLKDIAKKI